jgi:hypothetical protein
MSCIESSFKARKVNKNPQKSETDNVPSAGVRVRFWGSKDGVLTDYVFQKAGNIGPWSALDAYF